MSRVVQAVSVLLLGFALGGCSAGATTTTTTTTTTSPTAAAPGVVAAAEGGSDVGNDRPHVTYDGLMVRRRVVIAIQPTPDADLGSLRTEMDRAATKGHTTLSSISPSVLDPATLEHLSPEVTVVLPAGETVAGARRLIDPAISKRAAFLGVQAFDVASVLVHDLRFTVSSAKPALLADAISREGILSDALGNYTTILTGGELDITYTGPLLSDDLVASVRGGIARRAHTQLADVKVSPLSITGVGVDMSKEPALAPVAAEVSTTHNHSAGLPTLSASASAPAVAESSNSSLWAVSVVALAALLILTLVLLLMRRFNREQPSG